MQMIGTVPLSVPSFNDFKQKKRESRRFTLHEIANSKKTLTVKNQIMLLVMFNLNQLFTTL